MYEKSWPHAPVHKLSESGTYMVTGSTYLKKPRFNSAKRLDYLQSMFFDYASEYKWNLHGWSFFPNHYHFVNDTETTGEQLAEHLRQFEYDSAKWVNTLDDCAGEQVWYQFWDHRLTFQKSYFARLKYVHTNPVHHGIVQDAATYWWCSAAWFRENVKASVYKTVMSFKTDRVNVRDDFVVEGAFLM